MCPHFKLDDNQCGLCNEDEWDNMCMAWGFDDIVDNYCEAEEYTSDSGEDLTGYKNCAQYKLNEGGE